MNETTPVPYELDGASFDTAVEILSEAFHDYPAMRFFIAGAGERYDEHLRQLIGFFVQARVLRRDPILGVRVGDELAAVACVAAPDTAAPPELEAHRERLWARLGDDARQRYEAFGAATEAFDWPPGPQFHLSLIGVRRRHAGRGLARLLLDRVHQLSRQHPTSRGVNLTTEIPRNLALYEHFGYRRVGHVRLPGLDTWGFFRADRQPAD